MGRWGLNKTLLHRNKLFVKELIWGWPCGWFEILECAPLKVLGSISSGVNFGGEVYTKLCSGLEWGLRKWAVRLVIRISRSLNRILSFQKKKVICKRVLNIIYL